MHRQESAGQAVSGRHHGRGLRLLLTACITMEQVQVSQADLRCGSSGPAWAKLTPGAEGRVPIKPFGLTGHQTLRFTWSNNEFDSLDQNLPLFLRRLLRGILAERAPLFSQLLPEVAQPDIRTNSGSWSIY